jgi:hypothetical protein
MNDDALSDRRRANEDDYFRKRDRELIERMRRRSESEAARERLSQRIHVTDDGLADRLEALGFSDETVPLLHLAPLVQVAWVEDKVSPNVLQHIIAVAREHGIEELSEADQQLRQWLESKPSDAVFDTALWAIAAMLQHRSVSERERDIVDLLERCRAVAAASGGVLGFRKISRAERERLDHIRNALNTGRPSASSE